MSHFKSRLLTGEVENILPDKGIHARDERKSLDWKWEESGIIETKSKKFNIERQA